MAAEMRCQRGPDEDPPETQDRSPVEPADDPASVSSSGLKQSIVPDVLSNTERFSAVALENGPSSTEQEDRTQRPNTLVQHAKTPTKNLAKRHQEKVQMKDTKDERRERKFYCSQCPFKTRCPNHLVQHTQTHQKDQRNLIKCTQCSFMTLSEKDFRRHNVKHHSVFGLPGPAEKMVDSQEFFCKLCSHNIINFTVFRNHLLRCHQQTFEEYEKARTLEKAHVLENARRALEAAPNVTFKFPCKLCSYSTFSLSVFQNHLMQRHQQTYEGYMQEQTARDSRAADAGFTSNTEVASNRDASPGESVDFFKDGTIKPKSRLTESKPDSQETVDQQKDARSCRTSHKDDKGHQGDFYLFTDGVTVKTEDLSSSTDRDEDGAVQKDTLGFKESDPDDVEEEKQQISCSVSPTEPKRPRFEDIKTEEEDELMDPEVKEEYIETEITAETFDAHQMPLEEPSDLESEGKSCPYCPASFRSGTGLANHIRGHLHRVGLSYRARNVLSAEPGPDQH